MLLKEVTAGLRSAARTGLLDDPDIADVTHDSRRVRPGALFCCVPGSTTDGHDFAAGAVAAGATALLCQRELPLDVAQVLVDDPRAAMAIAAATFHGFPAQAMRMVGITGTNGKTTTVAMVQAMLDTNAIRTAIIGTLTAHAPGIPPTTPDSPDLQAMLAAFRDDGFAAVAMEVSSHALTMARVDAITYDVAAFTNLSRDHLDLHGTMEDYFAAKARLFTADKARTAVICVDDEWGGRLAGLAADAGLDVARCSVRDLVTDGVEGPQATVRWHGAQGTLHLAGRHNWANAVVAATIGEVLGLNPQQVLDGLGALQSVDGRFEYVDAGQPFSVVVDYAHTPDGVEVALRAARGAIGVDGQVTIVFGAGGERDRTKRPLMAAIAEQLADRVILTSDNPRHEDPRAILEEMRTGLRDPSGVTIDPDRTAAIRLGVESASPGDLVLIAGKGHETTQTIGDEVFPFDDRDVARGVLASMGYGGPAT
ncbi:MAG: UDP-N-acetylmuramoyl-L-alanyl-D-glutamate--2,6-diaminopimelate ligase [Actinobacteria bacterium]|nr:UDP-N-acetylmuramoyl-L-alanyl-D-glutamate--2,6-diaminopimelate ligase [Actinomycetota bacterium]